METKICTKCGQELPATNEYFYKNSKLKLGLQNECKTCRNKEDKKYYLKNKEKIIKKQLKYYKEHKEQISEYRKKYHQEHKEQVAEYWKKYYEEYKEQISERMKNYYQNNKYNLIYKQKKRTLYTKLRNTLHPSYIANNLRISTKDLTPELLEQKRLTILIKRELCK